MIHFGGRRVPAVSQADLAQVSVSYQHLFTQFTPRLPITPLAGGVTLLALVPTVPVVGVVVTKTFVATADKIGATDSTAGCLWHSCFSNCFES